MKFEKRMREKKEAHNEGFEEISQRHERKEGRMIY